MKKWILALFCVALTSTAWAQQYNYPLPTSVMPVSGISSVQPKPEPIPAPVPSPIPAPPPQAGMPFVPGATACADGSCGKACCNQPTKKVCMPQPSVKVKVSIKYSSVNEDKCYRTCFWPFGKGDCESCAGGYDPRRTDSPNCASHVITKRYLVKKIVTEDIPFTKCVPVEVPACGFTASQCGEWQYPAQPGVIQPGRVGPIPEPIPAPMPSKNK